MNNDGNEKLKLVCIKILFVDSLFSVLVIFGKKLRGVCYIYLEYVNMYINSIF